MISYYRSELSGMEQEQAKGVTFKKSTEKGAAGYEFIPTNLHVQYLRVEVDLPASSLHCLRGGECGRPHRVRTAIQEWRVDEVAPDTPLLLSKVSVMVMWWSCDTMMSLMTCS